MKNQRFVLTDVDGNIIGRGSVDEKGMATVYLGTSETDEPLYMPVEFLYKIPDVKSVGWHSTFQVSVSAKEKTQ